MMQNWFISNGIKVWKEGEKREYETALALKSAFFKAYVYSAANIELEWWIYVCTEWYSEKFAFFLYSYVVEMHIFCCTTMYIS